MDVLSFNPSKNPGKIGINRKAKQHISYIQVLNNINHKDSINKLKETPIIRGKPNLLSKNVFIILIYSRLIY